jgi:hypothetical protein
MKLHQRGPHPKCMVPAQVELHLMSSFDSFTYSAEPKNDNQTNTLVPDAASSPACAMP